MSIDVSADELTLLGRYLDLLYEANTRMNLTAVKDRDEAWRRHIIDSLSLLPFIAEMPEQARAIDIGSGGGMPGFPVAITQTGLAMTLLEATAKKAAFLRECAESLDLPHVTVVNQRAETIGQSRDHRQRYDLAIARAVGPMNVLLELTLPLVKVGGRVLAMKGRNVEAELRECGDALELLGAGDVEVFDAYPDAMQREGVIVAVQKDRPTPRDYPRLPGEPKRAPL
mgnify:CR=1 FL=1